MTFNRNINLL